MQSMICAAIAAVLVLASPAFADVSGQASVIDGDTLEIHGKRIRLHGVDAPESRQMCATADGDAWRCGQQAALALADKIGRQTVHCVERDVDRYGRIVAVCSTGGIDLNGWMVRSGLAVAYRQYSQDYVPAEDAARAAGVGIWAGSFDMPWDWRRGQRSGHVQPASADAPGECAIKGNINSKGDRIYHSPGQMNYDRTQINESKGERWFCSAEEARAAGWRPARR